MQIMARILIADDSLTIQKAFAMTFAGEDVTLLTARSADEGLIVARQSRPELVIADAVMPGRSGYDLCSAIKSDAALREVPVYILTSSQNPYDEVRGRQSGADGQFTKPFESVTLVENVKLAIAKGAVATTSTPPPQPRPFLESALAAPGISGPPAPASVQTGHGATMDDDYGEITIEDSGPLRDDSVSPPSLAASRATEVTPPPVVPATAPASRPSSFPSSLSLASSAPPSHPTNASGGPAAPGLRPSLIPGLRPGAAPSTRPGAQLPGRPVAAPGYTSHAAGASPSSSAHGPPSSAPITAPLQVPALRPPHSNASPQALGPGPSRTLVGLPATHPQAPGRFGAPTAPARPPTQPVRPLDGRTPPPIGQGPLFPTSSPTAASVSSRGALDQKIEHKIDQKMAAFAGRGPEYEAIAKLSREIIEKIVWEVVPELAEVIIREELQKRGRI
jgi:DNA-binding response OmpR family regulator